MTINKRNHVRIDSRIEAVVVHGDETIKTSILNISRYGLYIKTFHLKPMKDLEPGTVIELKIQLNEGETVDLTCRKIWSYKTASHTFSKNMGLEILNPPAKYLLFVENLLLENNRI